IFLFCAASAALTLGCDAGPKSTQPLDLPLLKVNSVWAATEVDTSVSPAKVTYGKLDLHDFTSNKAAATTSFHIRFNRLLLPSSATRQAMCLRPILTNVVGPPECVNGIFSEPSYDPVLREIAF